MESSATASKLYPTVDTSTVDVNDLVNNVVLDPNATYSASAPPVATEEVILKIHGAILHLIDKSYSVELACGDLEIVRLVQGDITAAVFARVADEIQWPLTRDEPAVKVDESHYFFSLRHVQKSGSSSDQPTDEHEENSEEMLNYGLTIASKGQEPLMEQLDKILADYSSFTAEEKQKEEEGENNELDLTAAKETSPAELKGKKKKMLKKECTAYWTTLAPNVDEYSGAASKLIAAGSGQLVKGVLWCGDLTTDRLMWSKEFMKRKLSKAEQEREVSPGTLKRLKRVKKLTRMTEKVANSLLSGVVSVSGFFSSSVINSKAGQKLFGLLPGEIVLATLDGFNKVCDAVEVSGRHVLKATSDVATEVVDHKYGAKTAQATNDGLSAAGHAVGTAWAIFKIRQALTPKGATATAMKPSSLAKTAIKTALKDKLKGKKTSK